MDKRARNERRRAFVRQVREYEKRQAPVSRYLAEEYASEDGCAQILVDLTGAELYNPLSVSQQRDLSPDIYAYIDEKAYPVPAVTPLRLTLIGVPEAERAAVEAILREHYDLRLRDVQDDLRLNKLRARSLFVIGVILMAVYFILAGADIGAVWYEIFSIIATFIVWEAADYAILLRHDIRIAHYDAAQMALAHIEFRD